MSPAYGQIATHDNMKVNVVAKSHLADIALFQPENIRNRRCCISDLLFYLGRRCSIEQLSHRKAKLPICAKDNDG
jgi:hypothetical protein